MMGNAGHEYYFRGDSVDAVIQVNGSTRLHVRIDDIYEELHPKPGKAPRRLTVSSILPPSNDNSGTARILGTTERGMWAENDSIKVKGGTSVMAYTLHSHWKKVSS